MQNMMNVHQPLRFSGRETVDSQELLILVNETRRVCGEKPIRNNDFVARIKDELEGETYEILVGQKNGADIEIIEMLIKQALRVAARESKAVRRSLVDKLEARQHARPTTPNEIIAAMALANVEQERRLSHIENQVEAVAECKQLVMAWSVPHKKVPHVAPGGQVTQMSVVDEYNFHAALTQMMKEAEQRGTQWYHPKMGRFSITNWPDAA